MPRKLPIPILTFCVLLSVFAQSATAHDLIPAGTILQCTIDEPNFSSKTATVGDPLLCHLSSLSFFGHSVFPRGAVLSGHLQDYKDPGHFFGKGWIQLEFDRIILPGAKQCRSRRKSSLRRTRRLINKVTFMAKGTQRGLGRVDDSPSVAD